ncbi:hypothetical protein [Streptomyces chartreusis]|uniref:hypothetical protein n=1 Tax=Streptomyces chartreusis TaxID=1969 RepID=UPI0037ADF2B3
MAFALAGLALGAVALWVDLDSADKVASVAGACAGFMGCALSIYFAVRRGGQDGHSVRASGAGAVAAGGSAVGNATGSNSKVTRRVNASPVNSPSSNGAQHQVTAQGPGAVAAAADSAGNATGEGSEVDEH